MQLAELFGRDVKTIGKHVNNVFREGELDETSIVAKFATIQTESERQVERQIAHYNLDVIISVGYRVKSFQGTQFRQWTTARLKEHLVQGYTLNKQRLSQHQAQLKQLEQTLSLFQQNVIDKALSLMPTDTAMSFCM